MTEGRPNQWGITWLQAKDYDGELPTSCPQELTDLAGQLAAEGQMSYYGLVTHKNSEDVRCRIEIGEKHWEAYDTPTLVTHLQNEIKARAALKGEKTPDFMWWIWSWDEENLWIHAQDPQDPDAGHIVYEFATDPGPELVTMIMESREVLLDIESLIDRKIREKRTVLHDVNIVMEAYDELHAAVVKGTQGFVGRKLTRERWKGMLDSLFQELDRVLTIEAQSKEVQNDS